MVLCFFVVVVVSKCEFVVLPRIADKIKGKEQGFCPRCECKYENRNTSVIKVVVVMVIWVISLLVVYMLFLILLEPLLNKRVTKGNYQEHTNEDVSEGLTMSLLEEHDDDESPASSGSRFSARRRQNRLSLFGYDDVASANNDYVDEDNDDDDDDSNRSISLFDAKDDVTLGANDNGALAASGLGLSSSGGGTSAADNLAGVAVDSHHVPSSSLAAAASGGHPMGARGNVLNRVGHQQDKWKRQVREQRKNIYDRHTMLN